MASLLLETLILHFHFVRLDARDSHAVLTGRLLIPNELLYSRCPRPLSTLTRYIIASATYLMHIIAIATYISKRKTCEVVGGAKGVAFVMGGVEGVALWTVRFNTKC